VLGEIFSLDRFRESAGGPAPSGEQGGPRTAAAGRRRSGPPHSR